VVLIKNPILGEPYHLFERAAPGDPKSVNEFHSVLLTIHGICGRIPEYSPDALKKNNKSAAPDRLLQLPLLSVEKPEIPP